MGNEYWQWQCCLAVKEILTSHWPCVTDYGFIGLQRDASILLHSSVYSIIYLLCININTMTMSVCILLLWLGIVTRTHLTTFPHPFPQVCSVQYCVLQLCTVQCTHIWTDLTVLWIGFCLTGPISLCLDSCFVYVSLCVACMRRIVTRWGGPGGIEAWFLGLLLLQCFDTVGWVIWPVKPVPNMTYNVFSGTLNPAQSILSPLNDCNAEVIECGIICCFVVFAGNSQVEKPVWRHSDSGHHSATWRCNQPTSDSDWQHYAGIHRCKLELIDQFFLWSAVL